MSDHLKLALPVNGDPLTPRMDGCPPDSESLRNGSAAPEVPDDFFDFHPVSMAWLTALSSATVIHAIPNDAYKSGMENINDRIRSLVDSSGRTQAEVARALGVTRATVGDWYHARSKYIRPENLEALAVRNIAEEQATYHV